MRVITKYLNTDCKFGKIVSFVKSWLESVNRTGQQKKVVFQTQIISPSIVINTMFKKEHQIDGFLV